MHSRLIMRFTSFASGSGGNCGLLRAGDTRILFDAGISLRRIRTHLAQQALTMQDISAVFLTHAHRDHVAGLRMLCKYHTLPVFATAETCTILRREAPEVIPRLCEIETQRAVELPDGLTVTAFPTMHDIQGSAGYVVGHNGLRFGLCTDLGCVTDEVFEALCGVQAAMLEANHDLMMLRNGPYPYPLKRRILSDRGHLSNDACGALVSELERFGLESVLLGHLSKENNLPSLALETVRKAGSATLQLAAALPDGAVTVDCGEKPCLELS